MSKVESRLFINGQFVEAQSGQTFELKNPSTGEHVAHIHRALDKDVDAAVAAAKAAQIGWAALPAMERAAILRNLGNEMRKPENVDKISELEAMSMGRNKQHYSGEILACAAMATYVASLAETATEGTTSLNTPGNLNITLRQPYGVVGAIIPWNVPVTMWTMKIAPAIAAGNAIILKSSEKAPLTSLYLAKIATDAGVPPGIINIVSGEGATGELIASHMEIRKIGFTGSTRAGRLVSKAAANSNLKNVTLELGGKSPTVIFEDACIEDAIKASTYSITWNSGQICMASSRIYVHENIAETFKQKFKEAMSAVKHDDPLTSTSADTIGPQADEVQGKSVLSYLDIGKQEGKALLGGNRNLGQSDKGYFIEPTIFIDVADDARINKEEIFGPVVIVHTFKDEEDAVRRANDTEYGLYASVFTQDINRAVRVSKKLEAGSVGVNCTSPTLSFDMPFGGFKQSGLGRELGKDCVLSWMETKSVFIKHE